MNDNFVRIFDSFTKLLMIVGPGLLIMGVFVFLYLDCYLSIDISYASFYVSFGSGLFAIGLALRSIKESRKTDRELKSSTNHNFLNLIDLFEKERLDFLSKPKPIRQYSVEVFVWKSYDYFLRAISIASSYREWIERRNKNRLANYFNILVDILIRQSVETEWRRFFRNKEAANIVNMYMLLWESSIVDDIKHTIKDDLIALFETYIGQREPGEDDITFFSRIRRRISQRPENQPFERILLEE